MLEPNKTSVWKCLKNAFSGVLNSKIQFSNKVVEEFNKNYIQDNNDYNILVNNAKTLFGAVPSRLNKIQISEDFFKEIRCWIILFVSLQRYKHKQIETLIFLPCKCRASENIKIIIYYRTVYYNI